MKKFQTLPTEGLQEVLVVFRNAKTKQEDILLGLNTRNPEFSKDLQVVLSKGYQKVETRITGDEQGSADDLLKTF